MISSCIWATTARCICQGRLPLLMLQLLLIGSAVVDVWANGNVDSHEIQYIPKLESGSRNSIQKATSSEEASSSPGGPAPQHHDYPLLIKKILNSHKQRHSQHHKKHQGKFSDQQLHHGYQTLTYKSHSNREMQDETSSSSQYSTNEPLGNNPTEGRQSTNPEPLVYSSGTSHQSTKGRVAFGHKTRHSGGNQYRTFGNEVANGGWVFGTHQEEPYYTEKLDKPVVNTGTSHGPHFDQSMPRSVTVQTGQKAVLPCKILGIAKKSMSWMRHEDLQLLSVGEYKFTTDKRISVVHQKNGNDGESMLTIEEVTESDAGMYRCQVSTKPDVNFIINLLVIVPKAEIVNGPELFVHKGSLINLTCVVTHGTETPVTVYWIHNNKVIDFGRKGGVTVFMKESRHTVSHLLMTDDNVNDSGVYACKPSNGKDASATLHVLNGEHRAAMHGNSSPRTTASWNSVAMAIAVVLFQQSWILSRKRRHVVNAI